MNVRSAAVVVVGALCQLTVWLLLRPDLAGPQWDDGSSLEVWLAVEAVMAVLIGVVAPDKSAAVRAVLIGWGSQMAHFAFLGEHYDDTLWGVGLYLEALLAAVGVGLALLARRATDSARRRSRVRGG